MGESLIPAKILFSDFPDVYTYEIHRCDTRVSTHLGLSLNDENGDFIGFLASENPDIRIGDVITAGSKRFTVVATELDYYRQVPDLLKSYYQSPCLH